MGQYVRRKIITVLMGGITYQLEVVSIANSLLNSRQCPYGIFFFTKYFVQSPKIQEFKHKEGTLKCLQGQTNIRVFLTIN